MDTTLEALAAADASEYFQKLFKTVSRQFIIYADEHGIDTFSMDNGLQVPGRSLLYVSEGCWEKVVYYVFPLYQCNL